MATGTKNHENKRKKVQLNQQKDYDNFRGKANR